AGGVHQRQDRQLEALGELHDAHRLAVALRPRHAEIVLKAAFRARALLVADDAQALAVEAAEAAHDRLVVAELAVARDRSELGDERADVVEAVRPLPVARPPGLLPCRQPAPDRLERL